MNRKVYCLIVMLWCCVFSSCGTFSKSADFARQARYEAQQGNYSTAFLRLRALLINDPHSPYAPGAIFSTGEYYYQQKDYTDAILTLYQYIKDYPKDDGRIFAELIIYKISTEIKTDRKIRIKERELIASIEKKIFSKPMFFLFFEQVKSYTYRSVLGNVYTAFDYVDKVIIKRNGQHFLEISP